MQHELSSLIDKSIMKRLSYLVAVLFILSGCSSSNGKVELRKSIIPCLIIPNDLPVRVDTGFAETDTIAAKRQAEKDKLWNVKGLNLKRTLENKNLYENEASQVYLINTSKSNIISFTIKIVIDDKLQTSSTKIYKTNPGEEVLLGCSNYLTEEMLIQKRIYKIVGEKKW